MVTFDAIKRQENLAKHGIDLAECAAAFDAPMLTEEDSRDAYGEQRLRSLGWLHGRVVFLVWTERDTGAHIISCRYANKYETSYYFTTLQS
jgi:uncharacterized DUF497 family protein